MSSKNWAIFGEHVILPGQLQANFPNLAWRQEQTNPQMMSAKGSVLLKSLNQPAPCKCLGHLLVSLQFPSGVQHWAMLMPKTAHRQNLSVVGGEPLLLLSRGKPVLPFCCVGNQGEPPFKHVNVGKMNQPKLQLFLIGSMFGHALMLCSQAVFGVWAFRCKSLGWLELMSGFRSMIALFKCGLRAH